MACVNAWTFNVKAQGEQAVQGKTEIQITDDSKQIPAQDSSESTPLGNAPNDTAKNAAKDTSDITDAGKTSASRRSQSQYLVLGNYAPIDLIIPGKYGITLGWVRNPADTYEFEYLKGSVSVPFLIEDLGAMSDERISLNKRAFAERNSFNITYGITYFDYSIHLGSKILNRLTSGSYPSVDLIESQSLGINFGIGNRWTFDHNITLGVDWFSWAQPLVVISEKSAFLDYVSNETDKKNVEDALDAISYFPRWSVLKVQIGMSF
jgi:hypothetical protein